MAEVRLNKWLAAALGVSRREADEMILAGRVGVVRAESKNRIKPSGVSGPVDSVPPHVGLKPSMGAPSLSPPETALRESPVFAPTRAVLGAKIESVDKVYVDGGEVRPLEGYTYVALHKPVGYVSSRRAQGEAPTLYELLPEELRGLKTVGRLDKDSSGLILLTDDGDFAHRMTHPSFAKDKVYEVGLDRELEPLHQQMIADYGLKLTDGVSKMGLEKIGEGRKRWRVTIAEGRNRQIRRTFGALGYTVVRLHRVRFGKYELGGLESGKWEEIGVDGESVKHYGSA